MIIGKEALSGAAIRGAVEAVWSKHLGLRGKGYRGEGRLVIKVGVAAASEARTIESVCDDLSIGVASNAKRGDLKHPLDVSDLREQEMQMNLSLSACLPTGLRRERCEMAIDCQNEPFYGKTPELRSYACRSEAKEGTTHF